MLQISFLNFSSSIINRIKAPKEELTRPSFSRPVKTEAQRDPKAGPSYLEKLKHKSSLGSTDTSGKGGASDWS